MASEETNRAREAFGMEPQPPVVFDWQYPDPQTIAEFDDNAITTVHNQAELGEITTEEKDKKFDEIERARILAGEGWFDRYGPPPEELDHLFVGPERYWEIPVEERGAFYG